MTENYDHIQKLALEDVEVLMRKGAQYGSSWRQRGGIGAFMMLARKWDRVEKQVSENNYDIFAALTHDDKIDGLRDDIADLRRYLFLVESFIFSPQTESPMLVEEAVKTLVKAAAGDLTGEVNIPDTRPGYRGE